MVYYPAIDSLIAEIEQRFEKNNNYEVLIAVSNIMTGVINDEEVEIMSELYNLDAQMLLSEANICKNCNIEGRSNSAVEFCVWGEGQWPARRSSVILQCYWNSCCNIIVPQSVPSAAYEGWKITQGTQWIRRLFSLAMCTIQRETANNVINNDI